MNLESLMNKYEPAAGIWDEMHDGQTIRNQYDKIVSVLNHLDVPTLQQKEKIAGELFMNQGVTFTVYSDNAGIERIFPFDILPRIITGTEWHHIESGIKQRLKARNFFLRDIYNGQQIVKEHIIPSWLI